MTFSPFLTIPRARSMIWPGSQQTMGELLDQDKLTCEMLRRASAKAENEQVRMAAEVLLVDRERKICEYIDGGNLPRNIDEAVVDDSNPIKLARRNAATLKGGDRLIELISEDLTRKFGDGYGKRNVQYFRKFYLLFNDFEIVNTCVRNLNWSRFKRLLPDTILLYLHTTSSSPFL